MVKQGLLGQLININNNNVMNINNKSLLLLANDI